MFEILIVTLAFVAVSLLIIIFLPRSIFVRSDEEEADDTGFIYQIKPVLTEMARLNAKIALRSYKESLQRKMIAAGEPFGIKITPDEFIALAQLAGLASAAVLSAVFGFNAALLFGGAALGFALPHMWLNDAVKARKLTIRRRLPDFLDLLTLAVEAGLDFNAALSKILKTSKKSALVEEFKVMEQELKLGTPRYQALKAMALRVDIPDFGAFVGALLQTDRLGASLGPTLRIQADQLRKRRMQLAEKAGGEASVKLLVPLMLFIFPAVFIMLLGPIVIQFLTKSF